MEITETNEVIYLVGALLIVVSAAHGFRKGLVRALGEVATSIVTILFLYILKTWAFEAFFLTVLTNHKVLIVRVVLCLLLYIGTTILLKTILLSLGFLTKLPVLRGLNKILGFLLGAVNGILVTGILLWILQMLQLIQ